MQESNLKQYHSIVSTKRLQLLITAVSSFNYLLSKGARLLGGDRTQVSQVWLVSDEHDHDVGIGVVAQLAQPAFDVLVGQVLRDVVHQKGADGTAIIAENYWMKIKQFVFWNRQPRRCEARFLWREASFI